ncbi:hypothetical protein ACP49_09265 [Clostridium botulinum]|uniref:hypothetical protein n=1 Tax=Clostridium botulinum TaxID=1491 RepID=UPI0006A7158E|nr:hypothetical protein [Clostridium botulinum]KOM97250.1 hypothetical protein ACP53_04155 [Clostridium botulinum]KON00753.1 hypothetical protein ACP49_09265 [Clostridium botulinum]MBY7003529.1 hypothetical protein [Clostridium botulinum]MCR1145997.1 hypothetical protein [Clostridium botulinum]NFH93136.1 hypothetical protein [Clostridium botulinum]
MKINDVLKEENILKEYTITSKSNKWLRWKHWTLIEDGSIINESNDLLEDCFSLWVIIHDLDFKEMEH